MKLTILGSGHGKSFQNQATAGYLLESGKHVLLLDFGNGVYKRLQTVYNPTKIHHILISHYDHVDHISDLAFFLFTRIFIDESHSPVYLYGPQGFKKFVSSLIATYFPKHKLNFKVHVKELNKSNFKIPGFLIQTMPVNHPVPAIGFRITAKNKVLTYSGDTGWCDSIIQLAKDADLFLLECTKLDYDSRHVTAEEGAQIAALAGAKKLVFTHMGPKVLRTNLKKLARKHYNGPVVKVKDLMKLNV